MKIVDWAVKNEGVAPTLWTMITTGQIVSLLGGADKKDFFQEPPKCLLRVDLQWRAEWLASRSQGALSQSLLKLLNEADEHSIRDIFIMFTKMSGNEGLPNEFIEKDLLSMSLTHRMQQVAGVALNEWVRLYVNAKTGKVDWYAGAPYTIVKDERRVIQVKHWSGCVASVPQYQHIGLDFELQSVANEMQAALVKEHVVHPIHRLFAKGEGPNRFLFDKKGKAMREMLEAGQQAMQAQRTAQKASGITSSTNLVLKDHVKERRVEALAKARPKMSGQAPRRKMRVVTVT